MGDDRSYEKALQRALRLLLYRGRSIQEMQTRLKEKGFREDIVGQVVTRLIELHYLDDGLFAREWARSCAVNKLWGNVKIAVSLREKGVPKELIDEALAQAREELSEHAAIERLVEKRFRRGIAPGGIPVKEKMRLARNLAGRGFPQPLIFDILRGLQEESFVDSQ